jgi:hypothetical protein
MIAVSIFLYFDLYSFFTSLFFTVTASMITFLWFIFSESLGELNWWIRPQRRAVVERMPSGMATQNKEPKKIKLRVRARVQLESIR